MRLRLINPQTHDILFDGDPNENPKDFRDAQRLVPDAVLEEVVPPPRPEPRREVAYVGAVIWCCLGAVLVALALGFAVRVFIWASGL